MAVALVLGTLAAASSPAVTMALMSELDAHGPVARALLGITVVKDVAVALLFALVLALGKALTSAGALNVAVAGTAVLQLVGSAAAGALLGYALGQYLVWCGGTRPSSSWRRHSSPRRWRSSRISRR